MELTCPEPPENTEGDVVGTCHVTLLCLSLFVWRYCCCFCRYYFCCYYPCKLVLVSFRRGSWQRTILDGVQVKADLSYSYFELISPKSHFDYILHQRCTHHSSVSDPQSDLSEIRSVAIFITHAQTISSRCCCGQSQVDFDHEFGQQTGTVALWGGKGRGGDR